MKNCNIHDRLFKLCGKPHYFFHEVLCMTSQKASTYANNMKKNKTHSPMLLKLIEVLENIDNPDYCLQLKILMNAGLVKQDLLIKKKMKKIELMSTTLSKLQDRYNYIDK